VIGHPEVPEADSLYVDAGGRRLHYLRAGEDGPAVVLLHGSGIDDAALSWRHALPALADRFHVYAPDWPGYGDSSDPDAEPDGAYYIEVLRSFLDAVPVDRPILVGLSMGGAAALGLTLAAPDRVRGLVLVDSYGLRDAVPGGTGAYLLANTPFAGAVGRHLAAGAPGGSRRAIAPFVANPEDLDPAFVEAVDRRLSEPGAGSAFVAFQRAEFRPDGVRTHFEDRLREVAVPTLVIHGEADPLVPPAWARDAAAAIPGAELSVVEDCGHWPPRERPEAFLAALEPFLDGVAEGDGVGG